MKKENAVSQAKPNSINTLDTCALQKAYDIQAACALVGFDWPKVDPVFDKVNEEIDELKAEVYCAEKDSSKIEEELGDLLFSVVNLARHLNMKPDVALAKANQKFIQRFALVESFAAEDGLVLQALDIDALEELWQRAKQKGTKHFAFPAKSV